MSKVVSHDAWAERIAEWSANQNGTFTWERGDGKIAAAYLLSPGGERIAAVKLEVAAGLVAALNSVEGRNAYAQAVVG